MNGRIIWRKIYTIIVMSETVSAKRAVVVTANIGARLKTKGEYVVAVICTLPRLKDEIITAIAAAVSVVAVSVCVQPHTEHVGCR